MTYDNYVKCMTDGRGTRIFLHIFLIIHTFLKKSYENKKYYVFFLNVSVTRNQ